MKHKMSLAMGIALFLGSGAFAVGKALGAGQKETKKQGFGVLSWNKEMISEEEEILSACLEKADISTVYQQF